MAGEDDDLVAKLVIEGLLQASEDLKKLATEGGESFDKLAAAAAAAGKKTEDAGDKINKASKKTADGMKQVAAVEFPPGFQQRLDQIAPRLQAFRGSLQRVVTTAARFGARMATLSAGVGAAGVAFAESARRVALGSEQQESALAKNTKAQTASNNEALQGRIAQINLASSQRDLQRQYAAGEITFDQYSQGLRKLNQDFREQQRVAREVAEAQRIVEEENKRLADQLAKTEAYNKLVTIFGGPLTSSLVQFGNRVEAVRKDLVSAFSPAIAAGVDQLTSVVSRNANAISNYFNDAAGRVATFIQQNGPAIQTVLEKLGRAAASVFDGLLAAAPSLIAFITNGVIPAVEAVVGFFNRIASTINAVFGTQLTGGFLIIIALLATMTGGLRLFFSVARSGLPLIGALNSIFQALRLAGLLPLVAVIALVVAGLYLLYTSIDWKKWGDAASSAASTIVNGFNRLLSFFTSFPTNVGIIFNFVWQAIQAGAAVAGQWIITQFNNVLAWFASFPGNLVAIFTTLWQRISDGWAELSTRVTNNWSKVTDYFAAFPGNLQLILQTVYDYITQKFQQAFDYVAGIVQGWATKVKTWIQPVLDLLTKALALFGAVKAENSESGGSNPKFARGGHVRGAGTSTSDSIAAWLSNNEFVVRAKAVRKYGTGLLNAINSGNLDLRGMMGFAAGGLVSMPSMGGAYTGTGSLPRGGGGLGSSGPMSVLNLTLDGQTYAGLLAPDEVAGRLQRAAVAKKVRSAGRAPGWS